MDCLEARAALSDAAHWDQPQYYNTIRLADIDGDGQAELIGRGPTGIETWHYEPATDTWSKLNAGGLLADPSQNSMDATPWDQPRHYTTIRLADIDGDGKAELLARGSEGIRVYRWNKRSHTWIQGGSLPELSDANGWSRPQQYSTIQLADIDGRPGAELIARGADGLHLYRYKKSADAWSLLSVITELGDANNGDQPQYYSTIQLADIDGRAGAELIARAADGVHVYRYATAANAWLPLPNVPDLNDAAGWDQPQYYNSIQLANIDGLRGAELIARGKEGLLIWRYRPAAGRWTRVRNSGTADIPSMSDANGWNLPQHYLTIQAADIDGRPGVAIIGRSATNIETWRFAGNRLTPAAVTGTPDFPAFTGAQQQYYADIGTALNNGTDIRANYDQLSSDLIVGLLVTLKNLPPPSPVSPNDPNWQAVRQQITTELTYVQTANDWMLGNRSSQTLITQIYTEAGLDIGSVAGKLTNVNNSATVAANILSLLIKIAGGVAAVSGVPVAPGMATILSSVFDAVGKSGGAPSLSLAVSDVQGRLATAYNAALTQNNNTHDALVTNWAQLKAFAVSKVGTVPTDDDMKGMRLSGEVGYSTWIWQTLSPVVWSIILPELQIGRVDTCGNTAPDDYPGLNAAPPGYLTYSAPNRACAPAWIGVGNCDSSGCSTPPSSAFSVPFEVDRGCEVGFDCRDPVNGPLFLVPNDAFLGQNGWNLPCQGPTCPLTGDIALLAERIGQTQAALRSLLSQVSTAVPDQALRSRLRESLQAAHSILKDGGSTQRDFARQSLQDFAFQVRAHANREIDIASAAALIAAANDIRFLVNPDAPLEAVYTKHSRSQNM